VIPRRAFLTAGAVLAGCGAPSNRPLPLPETIAGGWTRTDLREMPPASGVEPPARATVRRLAQADYTGPAKATVTLYELSSSGAALDAVQRFPPAADTVFFYKDAYFAVVKWQGAPDRRAFGEFVRALEKSLAAAVR
jgi:hypothetical protein